jgi:hypothetical protein
VYHRVVHRGGCSYSQKCISDACVLESWYVLWPKVVSDFLEGFCRTNSPTRIRRHPYRDQICVVQVVGTFGILLVYCSPSANSRLALQYHAEWTLPQGLRCVQYRCPELHCFEDMQFKVYAVQYADISLSITCPANTPLQP